MDQQEFSRRLENLFIKEITRLKEPSIYKPIIGKLCKVRTLIESGKICVGKPKVLKTGNPYYICENGLYVIPSITLKHGVSQITLKYFDFTQNAPRRNKFLESRASVYFSNCQPYWDVFIDEIQERFQEIKEIVEKEHLRVIAEKETISKEYSLNDRSLVKEKKLFQKKLGKFFSTYKCFSDFTPEEILGFLKISHVLGRNVSKNLVNFSNRNKVSFQFISLADVHEALQIDKTRDIIEA